MQCEVMDAHIEADMQIGILKCHMIWMSTDIPVSQKARPSIRPSLHQVCCDCSWRIVKRPPRQRYSPNCHFPPVAEEEPAVTDQVMEGVHVPVVMEAN